MFWCVMVSAGAESESNGAHVEDGGNIVSLRITLCGTVISILMTYVGNCGTLKECCATEDHYVIHAALFRVFHKYTLVIAVCI